MKSGPFNLSGEWSGVMGDVVNGKYQIALSTWYSFYERNTVVDLDVMIQWDLSVVSIILKPPNIDSDLFIRPFSMESWALIISVFIVQISINALSKLMSKLIMIKKCSFEKVVNLVSWFTFVVIYAFYSGALTMFFSTPAILPFDSIEDVLYAVPSWKLLMLHGTNAWFQNKADRVLNNTKIYPSFGNGN